ncbi:ATPase family associated with various cellular activities (AAA), putative [Angomonas deanei]|uniref:ATPase family associated with various cellular activities (AAA), putative n=1 Tax=Angomonas deanei TaxID=59799 RepID=A0A7G2CCT7_9TRYP|nr:ATPase family associated with various cellular activities (AAA), putative [Angomonas deanei]
MDPLERNSDEGKEKKYNYYKGFFDAEKRREVVNHEPTLGQSIFAACLSAVPIALLLYFVSRSYTRAKVDMQNPNSMYGQMRKNMQRMMNPAGERDFRVTVKDTTFDDVVGIPEAVAEVEQYVNFLRTPEKFTRLGGRLPKGCILTGGPGIGKTLLAKAVAGEAEVPFFSCSGADFIEVYAGFRPQARARVVRGG